MLVLSFLKLIRKFAEQIITKMYLEKEIKMIWWLFLLKIRTYYKVLEIRIT